MLSDLLKVFNFFQRSGALPLKVRRNAKQSKCDVIDNLRKVATGRHLRNFCNRIVTDAHTEIRRTQLRHTWRQMNRKGIPFSPKP